MAPGFVNALVEGFVHNGAATLVNHPALGPTQIQPRQISVRQLLLNQTRQGLYNVISKRREFDERTLRNFILEDGGVFAAHFHHTPDNNRYKLCVFGVVAFCHNQRQLRARRQRDPRAIDRNPASSDVIKAEQMRLIGPIRTGCATTAQQTANAQERLLLNLISALVAYSHNEHCFIWEGILVKMAYWIYPDNRDFKREYKDYKDYIQGLVRPGGSTASLEPGDYLLPAARGLLDDLLASRTNPLISDFVTMRNLKRTLEDFRRPRQIGRHRRRS